MRHAAAHIGFGLDHMVGAGALQVAAMLGAERLGPDVRDAEFGQRRRREHAGLDVGADRDHGTRESLHAEATQRLAVRRVGLDQVRQAVRSTPPAFSAACAAARRATGTR